MARTELTVQTVSPNGGELEDITFTAANATTDMMFANTGKEVLLIKNASGGSLDVEVALPDDKYGARDPKTISTGAGEQSITNTFDPAVFSQPAGGTNAGKVHLDIATDTSLSLAVVKFL